MAKDSPNSVQIILKTTVLKFYKKRVDLKLNNN